MAESDKSSIINLVTGQEEPFKICHRSIGQQIVLGTPPTPPGVITGRPPAAVPIALALGAPCIGPRCRMWDEAQAECLEVVACAQAMERNNLMERTADLISELTEQFRPPLGERRPLPVKIEGPVQFDKPKGK